MATGQLCTLHRFGTSPMASKNELLLPNCRSASHVRNRKVFEYIREKFFRCLYLYWEAYGKSAKVLDFRCSNQTFLLNVSGRRTKVIVLIFYGIRFLLSHRLVKYLIFFFHLHIKWCVLLFFGYFSLSCTSLAPCTPLAQYFFNEFFRYSFTRYCHPILFLGTRSSLGQHSIDRRSHFEIAPIYRARKSVTCPLMDRNKQRPWRVPSRFGFRTNIYAPVPDYARLHRSSCRWNTLCKCVSCGVGRKPN